MAATEITEARPGFINGQRLIQAREIAELTQAELAEAVGTTKAMIAAFEAGKYQPTAALVEALALATGFPPTFFDRGDLPEFENSSLEWHIPLRERPRSQKAEPPERPTLWNQEAR